MGSIEWGSVPSLSQEALCPGGAGGGAGCTVKKHRKGPSLHTINFHSKVFFLQNILDRSNIVVTGHIPNPHQPSS